MSGCQRPGGPAEAPPQIVHTPGVCGGRARLAGTRITVWGLMEYRRGGLDDSAILEAVPGLTAAELTASWTYADEHRQEIEADLRANDE